MCMSWFRWLCDRPLHVCIPCLEELKLGSDSSGVLLVSCFSLERTGWCLKLGGGALAVA